jgi:hypothetical protein
MSRLLWTGDETFMPIAEDVHLGNNVIIRHPYLVNLYGCGVLVMTRASEHLLKYRAGASVGACCKVSSHTFICEGVTIEDEVFIGHGVMFTNDLYPRATSETGAPRKPPRIGEVVPTVVRRRRLHRVERDHPSLACGSASAPSSARAPS